MAQNPVISQLDSNQIVRRTYDEANDAVRTELVNAVTLAVTINHDDSIVTLGTEDGAVDGTYHAVRVTSDGSLVVSPLSVFQFFDTPVLIAASVNIPASGSTPLEVISITTAVTKKIKISDTTGKFIGIYAGAIGFETLKVISGPGADYEIGITIPASTRISVRNMANSLINTGSLCIQFMG